MSDHSRLPLLAAIYLGTFVALLDVSVVTLALPTIEGALSTDIAGLQWVIDAYALCLSAFMLTAGALGDRYGRKRCWLVGVVLFTAGSAICAAAPGIGVLLAGRVVQGIAGALIVPGSLSIISQAFRDPNERSRVIGGWGAFSVLSLVVGPVLGGILVDLAGWQSIFLINLPLGAVTLVLGWRGVPESSDPDHAAIDPAGQATSILWLGALTYGFIAAGSDGWNAPATLTAFAVAAAAFIAFVVAERRAGRPMVPLGLFRTPSFAAVNAASFVLGFSAFSSVFLFSLFLQMVQGYAPLEAGVRMMPEFLATAVVSALSGRLSARWSEGRVMVAGYVVLGLAAIAGGTIAADASYPALVVLFIGFGVGMGLAIPATNAAAMTAVARERSGMASGIVNAARQAGTATGIALLGTVMSTRAIALLSAELASRGVPDAASVASAAVTRHAAPESGIPGVHALVGAALAGGFAEVMLIAGAASLAAALALAAVGLLRRTSHAAAVASASR